MPARTSFRIVLTHTRERRALYGDDKVSHYLIQIPDRRVSDMMTDWKLCKSLKFDHTTKWYIHKPESVQENENHKILWDSEIQTDSQIPARLRVDQQETRICHLYFLLFYRTAE